MRVHARVNLDYESALGGMRVNLDHRRALNWAMLMCNTAWHERKYSCLKYIWVKSKLATSCRTGLGVQTWAVSKTAPTIRCSFQELTI